MSTKQKIKILLIENDEMMRIFFRDIFWIHGEDKKYDLHLASSINEARLKINNKDSQPDTIFLDVMIPEEGKDNSTKEQIARSINFVEEIKSDSNTKNTKIIIYSSHKDKDIQDHFKKIGVDGYLIKGEMMPKEIIAYTDKIHGSNN